MKISFFLILLTTIFIGCGVIKDPLGLERWEVISDLHGDYKSLFFIDEKIGWAVGSDGKIVSTQNGGLNWISQKSNTTSKLRSILFINENVGFISGNDQTLLYTNDGGKNWNRKTVICDSGTVFNSLHSDINGNIWFITNYGEIFSSINQGFNWECRYQLKSWGFSYLYFSNNYSGIAMPGIGRTLFKKDNGSETWKSVPSPVHWIGDVCFIDENNGWISDNWGPSSSIHETASIFFTGDRGENWTKLSELPGIVINNIKFVDNSNGWVTEVTQIYHTTDGGKNWIRQFDSEDYNIGYIRDIFFINLMVGWGVTSKGKIIKYIEK